MTRGDRFIQYDVKPRAGGHPFSLDRPTFLAGTNDCKDNNEGKCPPLKPHRRNGDASDVLRPAFLEDSTKPRTVLFDGDELKK